MNKETLIGRAVSSTIYAKKPDNDNNSVQMTARLDFENEVYLQTYVFMSKKSKNEALNDILSIGFAVYAEELEKADKDARIRYNNLTHDFAGN